MTVLMMTGVTALSRGIAGRMEANGVTYPAEKVRGVLRDNDLLHISRRALHGVDLLGHLRDFGNKLRCG